MPWLFYQYKCDSADGKYWLLIPSNHTNLCEIKSNTLLSFYWEKILFFFQSILFQISICLRIMDKQFFTKSWSTKQINRILEDLIYIYGGLHLRLPPGLSILHIYNCWAPLAWSRLFKEKHVESLMKHVI